MDTIQELNELKKIVKRGQHWVLQSTNDCEVVIKMVHIPDRGHFAGKICIRATPADNKNVTRIYSKEFVNYWKKL